ncbi:Beta-arrestin-1 [Eufriesea mexicana]|uniref:Beta-arrestin-1 n=1 Tax=Eufriesea mexicana TaxID=516756 RepID=A0A310SRC5_9HYME|nr:Beta-arrestin-1 [Eufriesea mexicana]
MSGACSHAKRARVDCYGGQVAFTSSLQWDSSESEYSEPEDSNELRAIVSPEICAMDTVDSASKRQTRVFKKSSLNGKITVYIGKRDFVDHITHVDPIDGVVLIDPDYVKDRKVFGHVLAAFKYGREDLDVLGLTFHKNLYLAAEQIYPVVPGVQQRNLTRLQEKLIKKLGSNAYPFYFELPPHCPASVTLQTAPGDSGKPCGIDYELKTFVGETPDDKPQKRNSVRLAIRKIMYAPSKQGKQPSVEVSKEFVMSPNKLHLEVSLDKELYYHGENIAVNVHIGNNSNRTVKKIKVSVRQFADICLFSTAQYKCTVAEVESDIGVSPGFTLSKVFSLRPTLADNKEKRGLALDGQLKHEDTNLASSTMEGCPVGPGFTLSKVFFLKPLLANNKNKCGLALDGQIKDEDTNLASSTLCMILCSFSKLPLRSRDVEATSIPATSFTVLSCYCSLECSFELYACRFPVNWNCSANYACSDCKIAGEKMNWKSMNFVLFRSGDPSQRENLGIFVQYKVKVKLCLGTLARELVAELPFILMHPKPEEEEPAPPTARPSPTQTADSGEIPLDTNLIELDTDADGDDIIFEDFARLRLKGETDA